MRRLFLFTILGTSMLASPAMAAAQSEAQVATGDDAAALRAELENMRAQMEKMQRRLDALEGASAPASISAPIVASAAEPVVAGGNMVAAAPAAVSSAKPETSVNWRGAPEWKRDDGWSFKPRGRLQVDMASVDTPTGVTEDRGGFRTEFRRLYLGVDGTVPGGFGYRLEFDLAGGDAELTDGYISYGTGPLSLTVGQVKTFWGLEEMTSDLFTSMMERSTISQAFGFERRVGLSAEYAKDDILLQGGVFGANASDLLDDRNNSFAADGRAIWSPKLGDKTQLHLGGSLHMRDLNDAAASVRYRARPGAHTTDLRLVDTGNIAAKGERSWGLEGAVRHGPFHATAEGYWQKVRRADGANPTFFGGYAEVGMVLTKGDSRGYKKGAFDRLKPSNPIHKGGPGAIEVNLRYDHLDLNDVDITGGKQQAAWLSLVWAPMDYVRLTANYGKLWISDARVAAANGDREYQADTFGLRTQIDF